ncbi:hypothetical protein Patl1_26728 [Pistacia atlantica]|uniref:Uncharacterized protein n=1 Tax=Pistacia atlantica TaxID=434234 RepID=A0ACC1B359_9ROSI|nr:hypothetical protein Patl1_26728 [Pistacia atlantica]
MEETVGSSALQSCTYLIGDQFSLLYNYKTNFENLRAQVEKLTLVRQRVQHKILGAERIGKKVERGLMVWLNKANKLIDEANTMMEDEWKGEDRCFGGLCPNLGARHQLSKKAVRKVKAMALLLSRPEIFQEKFLKRYKVFIGDEWDWFGEHGTSRTFKLKLSTRTQKYEIIRQLKGIEELYLDELLGVNQVLCPLDGAGFPHLKHLHIQNNSSQFIVHSMGRKPRDAFPILESLFLHNLINLEKIFHGQFTVASFCKLKIIKVEKCDKLKNVFSFLIASGLQQLQTLEITECKNMEHIFVDESEEDIDNNRVIDNLELGHIRSLTLKSLPQLTSSCLKVTSSNEVILEDELLSERLNEEERKDRIFPRLECLVIKDLEKLTRFCSGNYIEFPSLKHLEIVQCPLLKAFMFTNISTDSEETQPFFNEKVALPSLEEMVISGSGS